MALAHPCLYFDESDVSVLRIRVQTDPVTRERYRLIVRNKEDLLAEEFLTEEYANSVFDQHGKYYDIAGQIGRMNEVLGSAWLIEKDRACFDKLKALLEHVSSFERWAGPDNAFQEVPRRSELTTAEICSGAAYTFDIIYNGLTRAERRRFADAIIQKGAMPLMMDWVLPETRIHAMDSMGHNWWAVCIALGALALLPMRDEMDAPRRNEVLDLAEQALIAYLSYPGCTLFNKPASYDAKGLFYESVSYFAFGTGELLQYLFAAERVRGRREALRAALPEGMDRAILSFAYPVSKAPGVLFADFGDGSTDADVSGMLRWYLRLGFASPAAQAYLTYRSPHRSFVDLMHPALFARGNWDDVPRTVVYPETGYAFVRSSWEKDGTMLALRCGFTWNHAHADAGHFMLWDRGVTLIPDGGTCSYGSPLYRTYFCKDEAHNVLLIGHKGQNPEEQYRGSKFPGKLFDHYLGADFVYLGADATGPMSHLCRRMYRNFLWIENRVLVVIDDVRCNAPDTVQFLLHLNGERTETERDGLPCTLLKDGPASAALYHVYPSVETREVTDCVDGDRALAHLEYSTVTKAQSVLSIKVFVLRPDEREIRIKQLRGNGSVGVELRESDRNITRRVWFNLQADGRRMHVNSNNVIDGFETDAYLLMRTLTGDAEQDFLAAASYHRKPGEAGFASYIKKTDVYAP